VFAGQHADGSVGPLYKTTLAVPADAGRLALRLTFVAQPELLSVGIILRLDGWIVARHSAKESGEFSVEVDV
jgi:hypothetical protein